MKNFPIIAENRREKPEDQELNNGLLGVALRLNRFYIESFIVLTIH